MNMKTDFSEQFALKSNWSTFLSVLSDSIVRENKKKGPQKLELHPFGKKGRVSWCRKTWTLNKILLTFSTHFHTYSHTHVKTFIFDSWVSWEFWDQKIKLNHRLKSFSTADAIVIEMKLYWRWRNISKVHAKMSLR